MGLYNRQPPVPNRDGWEWNGFDPPMYQEPWPQEPLLVPFETFYKTKFGSQPIITKSQQEINNEARVYRGATDTPWRAME
jgi:hypothetical protein